MMREHAELTTVATTAAGGSPYPLCVYLHVRIFLYIVVCFSPRYVVKPGPSHPRASRADAVTWTRGWIGKSAHQQAASSSFGEACA
jgi:hypothetical protein